jgi:hypothetical protein
MRIRRRVLPDFESCSVALFALLAVGGAWHARAQTAPAPTARPGVHAPAPQMSATAAAIPANQWTLDQIDDAFRRTDADRDGVISRNEAKIWNGLTRKFDQVDTNHDGTISRTEFLDALK